MTNAINALTATNAATTTASAAATGTDNTVNKDTFLKLLVAQLKNQNPMSPTDGTQFLQQTAQFTMVETLQDIAKQSTSMLSSQHATEAVGMLGQHVSGKSSDGKDVTGIVTGMHLVDGNPQLKVNGQEIAFTSVTEVDRPTA
ncbi:MAG: flagellar basal-body rod modification protein FlgD [Acidimicrobiaceae bacterium]|jgi:flagellar basal-body rod modification protein FlgD|nr:flagellar basal-body rod modification protein FlgD [Acidimicrobiaceae bacterium]